MSEAFQINGVDLVLPDGLATPKIARKLRSGLYEAAEAAAISHAVRPGFRVLELGAGLGYVTTLCARATGPANVLSVEANPALLPVIEGTLARNGCAGVDLFHGAVTPRAEEGETIDFTVSPGFTGSRLDGGKGDRIAVPAIGFHDLLHAHRPHVVIMDIEGAEARLFNRPWKCPLRFCVMELHPRLYKPRAIKRIVDAMSAMNMTYDPVSSRGKVLGFRRVWDSAEGEGGETP